VVAGQGYETMSEIPLFPQIVAELEAHYGIPRAPEITDPLGLILYETLGYLASDERRDGAFAALRLQVGLEPIAILGASMERLTNITRLGGIHPGLRAARLKEIAQIVLNDFDGDLDKVLRLSQPKASKALRKFPSIGAPGAEKILLFTKTYPVLALESNGLRVLLRLGFGEERKNYSASYASVQEALKDQTGNDFDFLIRAHQLLRRHGKELCRNANPACEICPLTSKCAYYQKHGKLRKGVIGPGPLSGRMKRPK
jgi:endonuclease-3